MMSLFILTVLLIHFGFLHCQNTCPTGVTCSNVGSDVSCSISQSSSYSLRDVEACFSGNYKNGLVITKNAPGQVVFIIDSNIGATSLQLSFVNLSPQGKFVIRARVNNVGIRAISFAKNGFHIDESYFFDYFPHVQDITTFKAYLTFGFSPTFSYLKGLSALEITVSDPNEELTILTADMLQNTNIERLRWSGSLKSIEPSALNSLRNLTKLDLTANFLTTLPDGIFNNTEKIENIILDRNMIDSLSIDIFDNLNRVTSISIDYNPNFPYESLQSLGTLKKVSLNYNSYTSLDSFPFQQLHELSEVSLLGNPFNCDCDLRWVQFLSLSGVTVADGICFSPVPVYNSSIIDDRLYASCQSNDSSETYPCFDKSIVCPRSDLFCHNNGDNYLCNCAIGLALDHTNECIDVNECTSGNLFKCRELCVNTLGSYKCDCNDGYRLKSDGISCEDVNECAVDNGGCVGGCKNVAGGFSCICETGLMIVNGTDCGIDIGWLSFIVWGFVASLLSLCLIISLVATCICLCRYKRSKSRKDPSSMFTAERSLPATPSTYTRMETVRPEVPRNRPQLPPSRPSTSGDGSLARRPIVHEELTYEAFDVDN